MESIRDKAAVFRYVPIQVPGKGWTVVKAIGSKRLGRTYENAGFPETYTLAQAQLAAQNALRDMKQNPVARRKPKTDQDIFDMAETRGGRTGLAIGKRKHAYAVIDNYVQINQKTKQNIGKHNASILAEFPFTKIGKANAIQYARAYHRYAPRHDLAVIKT